MSLPVRSAPSGTGCGAIQVRARARKYRLRRCGCSSKRSTCGFPACRSSLPRTAWTGTRAPPAVAPHRRRRLARYCQLLYPLCRRTQGQAEARRSTSSGIRPTPPRRPDSKPACLICFRERDKTGRIVTRKGQPLIAGTSRVPRVTRDSNSTLHHWKPMFIFVAASF